MNKRKSILTIIILLLIIPSINSLVNIQDNTDAINSTGEKQDPINIELKEPKSSAGAGDYYYLHIDDTGASGNGTWAWTASTYAWCADVYADGSLYVIEDITLNRSGTLGSTLIIANSTRPFIIQNCSISNSGSDAGISLFNASNGKIFDCKIFDNTNGIILADVGGDDSKDNIIKNNTIDSNSNKGIYFENGEGNEIINNTITNHNGYSVYLYSADASLIENNTIDGGTHGLFFQYADNVVARNNTIIGSTQNGIRIYDTLNLELSGNTMQDCGIYLDFNVESELRSSTIYNNNTANGKTVYFYKDEIGLDSNDFKAAGQPGQILLLNCSYSDISDFNLSDASVGVELYWSEYNTISNITANNGYTGIYLRYYSHNNTIFNNTIHNNLEKGIYLDQDCTYNNISYNDVRFSTGHGIHFTTRCENNTI